ncbi:YybH family protein [Solicola gregarius]|uniref:Nuclear transport factor 2 family protein n=1 Tax=Solicola gregarius TaxID=2908642 RepID=A0AA46YKJ4_9ACTN|nr:nuclear transport factor 2 family protein [Solicola gregarius]UYM05835.1 nuclear transport factor 2 family protein [Solicola gregarius]
MTATQDLRFTDNDERAIRELVQAAHEAQIDTVTLPALHSADAIIVNIAGRRLFGRDEFVAAMAKAVASPLRDVTTTVEVVDVRPVTDDVAIVSSIKSVHDARSEQSGELPERGAFTYVVTRTGEDWRIALAQTTPIAGG